MKNQPIAKLQHANWLHNDATQRVFSALVVTGAEACAVGGAIRNTLLDEDVHDIDIATTAMPDEIIAAAREAGLKAVPTGYEHGTVTILSGGTPFEVTTLREDVQTHGRHAVVQFGSDWQRDAERRDFTMNALYADRDGNVFDLVDGYQDCLERRVRFIGSAEKRIQEDYLRILRYFRFQATYGSQYDDVEAREAIVANRDGVEQLSAERLGQEMRRLLPARDAARVVSEMAELGLIEILIGNPPHLDLFRYFKSLEEVTDAARDSSLLLFALAGFVIEDVDLVAGRLRLANAEKNRMITGHQAAQMCRNTSTDYDLSLLLYKHGRVAAVDGTSIAWSKTGKAVTDRGWLSNLERLSSLPIPEFPVTGGDLVSAGVKPGELVGKKLRKGENTWIDSKFRLSRSEILEIIQN